MDRSNEDRMDITRNEWEDQKDLVNDRARLAEDRTEGKANNWGEEAKDDFKHAGNVVEEKATEMKDRVQEGAQKAKHRLEETFDE